MKDKTFLQQALILDAAATGATMLLAILGAGVLAGVLGLPAGLLRGAGLILIPFVALVAWAGMRARPARAVVATIIGLNALWVAASIGLLIGGWVSPTALGYAFVIAQALVVGVFAWLQFSGLRKMAPAA